MNKFDSINLKNRKNSFQISDQVDNQSIQLQRTRNQVDWINSSWFELIQVDWIEN